MKLALSTSCFAGLDSGPDQMIGLLDDLCIRHVEIEYRINAAQFHSLVFELKRAGVNVTSLHNYCPFPALIPGRAPSGDYFRLSSPDREERSLAVQWTTRTLEQAHELEAGVVVLHTGAVDMPVDRDLIEWMVSNRTEHPEKFNQWRTQQLDHREQSRGPILDSLLLCLDRLIPIAEKYGIRLGIENRYHLHELPSLEEMHTILLEFRGAPVGYWHDAGHAHMLELLGIYDTGQWLSQLGESLCGIHLHDAVGSSDHLPPGDGEIDFTSLTPFVKTEIPLVMELAPGTDSAGITRGAAAAKSLFDLPSANDED
ncbi:MAG: sugar phosphate isomerase/epimerase [Desulfobacteraceae bacterium]|nr:sugar phosphate isomerase/epimerase [Desulfobacteraceae bacterium]